MERQRVSLDEWWLRNMCHVQTEQAIAKECIWKTLFAGLFSRDFERAALKQQQQK